jgi:pyridoxamine 5'-phosphate oxidase
MDKREVISIAGNLLSDVKTAVLATADKNGSPHMRWMSPVFLRNFQDQVYAVTSTAFSKTSDISNNGHVQWMLQSKTLDTVITFNGIISMLENQALKNEVLQAVGAQLQTFWKINKDSSALTVLETEISSAVVFYPVKGQKFLVSFAKEV